MGHGRQKMHRQTKKDQVGREAKWASGLQGGERKRAKSTKETTRRLLGCAIRGTFRGQVLPPRLAFVNPVLGDDLEPVLVQQAVHKLDCALTDASDRTNLLERLVVAKEHAGEVDSTARDGYWAAPHGDVALPCAAGDGLAVGLERNGEIKVIPVAHHKVLGRGRRGKVAVLALGGRTRLEVERAFEGLVALPNLLLRHTRQFDDLAERPRHSGLPAGDEDAGGDDSVDTLPTQELLLVAALV
jgi:hypothetical protein